MRKRVMLVVATLLGCTAASAQMGPLKLEAVSGIPEIDKTTQTQDIQFRNAQDNRMTVPVRLSGSGPYRFLVDTAADRTAVSRQIVSDLKLVGGSNAQLHSVAGVSMVKTARVNGLELTKPPEQPIEAVVLDGANMGADGIVGVDVLRSQRVEFDFAKNIMSIVPSALPDFRGEPGTIVVNGRRKNGRLIVSNAEANGKLLTLIIDTGSEVSIGNAALRRRLLGTDVVDPSRRIELESVTGAKIVGDYTTIRELKLGGIVLNNLVIVFADAHTFNQLKMSDKPALLLGMNAIRAFKKVSIDFANRKFRVVLPEHSSLDVRVASLR